MSNTSLSKRPAFDANWTIRGWDARVGATATEAPEPVFVRAFDYPAGYVGRYHQHRQRQIIYPVRGVAVVATATETVTVAPYRAVTIPPWVRHRVSGQGNVALRSVFIDPSAVGHAGAPREPVATPGSETLQVIGISALLHELIKSAGEYFGPLKAGSTNAAIVDLLSLLLTEAPPAIGAVRLPLAQHDRIRSVQLELLAGELAIDAPAAAIAASAAMSPRNFRRQFKAQAGLAFKDWRTLLRVQRAASVLAQSGSVTTAALSVGLSPGALGTLFVRVTGLRPRDFLIAAADTMSPAELARGDIGPSARAQN